MKLNKINILYPIFLLGLLFFILIFDLIRHDFNEYENLNTMKENVIVSTKISALVYEIQKERGLSIACLVSKKENFREILEKQRKKTDVTLLRMNNKIYDKTMYINKIQKIREEIDENRLTSNDILSYYSNLNDKLLSTIIQIAQSSTYPEITRELTAYSNFLFSKELLGIQRAIGIEIISFPKLNKKKILEFYSLIVRQKQYINQLKKFSPPQYKEQYEKIIHKMSQTKIETMQDIILSFNQTKINTLDMKIWFAVMSEKIDHLTLFENYISGEIISSIENEISNLMYPLGFNVFLNLMNVFLFFLIVIFILRLIKNEKKLQELTDEYIISSHTDKKGIITSVSKAFVKISGYSKCELIGHPHNIVRHPDMSKDTFRNIWQTLKNGDVWEGDVKNRTKDGGYYWVKSSIIPEFDSKNNIIGYTSLRYDITSEKSKEEFMANMSHELRTPLNSIIGFSDILHKKLKESNNIKYISRVKSSAKVLLKLINDILDLSKIKDSKFTIEPYEFNAYEEVTQYADTFRGLTSKKNVSLELKIDKNLKGLFFGDWMRISQVILNIISNAIKFTPKDGKVTFIAEYRDEHFVFSVEDNGIGMKKEVQDKIFLPFEQADGSTTRKYGGTGLGLSITQSLVELMKGNISLESQESKGSKFTITIPLKKMQESQTEVRSIEQESGSNKLFCDHILVAEDNSSNQMLIELLLKEYGITCDIVADGEEAVEKYDLTRHSFILMDENMPKMNGLVAMQTLKEKYGKKCGKIIALTANTMSGDRERFLALGMDNYLSKPLEKKELESILNLYAKPVQENSYITQSLAITKEKTHFSEKIVHKLLTAYYESSLKLLDLLYEAIQKSDYDAIHRAAHDIKSTSGSLNFIDIANLIQQMERDAQEEKSEVDYMEVYTAFKRHIELVGELV